MIRQLQHIQNLTETRAIALLIGVAIWLAFTQPILLQSPDIVLARAAVVGIVAIGLTMLIVQGEIDLSVGSVAATAAAVVAVAPGPLGVRVLLAIVFGLAVGAINAFLVVRIGVNSFIATLGTMIAIRGLALFLLDSKSVPLPDALSGAVLINTPIVGLPLRTWAFVLVVAAGAVLLSRTRYGRDFYAVGGSREAARAVGIPIGRRLTLGFLIVAAISALAGVIDALFVGVADPTSGSTILLISVAAAVIGGCSLAGGRGTALGTALGTISISGLAVGLGFAGADPSVQEIATGGVLFLAVITDKAGLAKLRDRLRSLKPPGTPRPVPQPTTPAN